MVYYNDMGVQQQAANSSTLRCQAKHVGLKLTYSELDSCSEFHAHEESLEMFSVRKLPGKLRGRLVKAVTI